MADDTYLGFYYKVFLNGKKLDDDRFNSIQSINIEENSKGSDTCTMDVQDPNFVFIEDNIFSKEATVKVVIGAKGFKEFTFNGYISAIDISFPDTGAPTLSIFCLDKTHLMNTKKKSRTWSKVTRADVAKKIAAEYGLSFSLQSGYKGTVEDTISQSDQTDIEFLESLAENEYELFMCKVIDKTVHYKKMGVLKTPVATFKYREYPYDIISFSPQVTKEDVKESSTNSDVSTSTKSTYTSTSTPSSSGASPSGSSKKSNAVEPQSSAVPQKGYTYNSKTGKWVETKR